MVRACAFCHYSAAYPIAPDADGRYVLVCGLHRAVVPADTLCNHFDRAPGADDEMSDALQQKIKAREVGAQSVNPPRRRGLVDRIVDSSRRANGRH